MREIPPLKKVFIVIAFSTFPMGLAALWWWALFGMSDKVASAWIWTIVVLAFVGFGVVTAPIWDED